MVSQAAPLPVTRMRRAFPSAWGSAHRSTAPAPSQMAELSRRLMGLATMQARA